MKKGKEPILKPTGKIITVKSEITPPKQWELELLKDPILLWKIVLDGLDHVIVGEENARKTIFLCAIGSRVLNASKTSYNLMVNSESGAGKDHVVDNVLRIFKEDVLKRTRISPMALTYWHNSHFEPNWTWDGKVLYLEDVSNEILNCDVFKVFASGGSFASVVKDQRTIDIEVKGKPVVIITSASADPEPELVRRFMVVNLTESKKQTEEIMEKWCDHATKGFISHEENQYHLVLKHIRPRKVKIPFAKYIHKNLPKDNIIMRTVIQRFLDFIKASTVLYQYARYKDEDDFIHADWDDYKVARDVIISSSTTAEMVPLTQYQKEIIEALKNMGTNIEGEGFNEKDVGWTQKDISAHVPLDSGTLYKQINKLVKAGHITKGLHKFEFDNKRSCVYKLIEKSILKIPTKEEMIAKIPVARRSPEYKWLDDLESQL